MPEGEQGVLVKNILEAEKALKVGVRVHGSGLRVYDQAGAVEGHSTEAAKEFKVGGQDSGFLSRVQGWGWAV